MTEDQFGPNTVSVLTTFDSVSRIDNYASEVMHAIEATDTSQQTAEDWHLVLGILTEQPYAQAIMDLMSDDKFETHHVVPVFLVSVCHLIPQPVYWRLLAPLRLVADPPQWKDDKEWVRLFFEAMPNVGCGNAREMVDALYNDTTLSLL